MNVRQQCVEILEQMLENKTFLGDARNRVEIQHRSFANMLLLTALRRLEALRQILDKFLHKKIPEKDKKIYYVLLLGGAEILYLNTPEYAAINEYVNIAKKYTNRFGAGMVNAVLRQINVQKKYWQKIIRKSKLPRWKKRLSSNRPWISARNNIPRFGQKN